MRTRSASSNATSRSITIAAAFIGFHTIVAEAVLASPNDDKPAALREMVNYRDGWRTGRVEYALIEYESADRHDREPREISYTARFTPDAEMSVNRGDESGVTILSTEGGPAPVIGKLPYLSYSEKGYRWQRSDHPQNMAWRYETPNQRSDIRVLGASVVNRLAMELHDLVWGEVGENPMQPRFEEDQEGELQVVKVKKSYVDVTYWIDPQRGWSPVRVRYDYPNGQWAESRSRLKNWDGVWFSESVETYSSRFDDGRKPTSVLRVFEAEFNKPEHPQTLSPQSIGVTLGQQVLMFEKNGRSLGMGFYEGRDVVSFEEYIRRREAGELHGNDGDRTVEEISLASSAEGKKTPTADAALLGVDELEKLTPWEEYTRDFITRYQLNDEQTQKAWSICRERQDRAREYLRSKRETIVKIDERTAVLRTAAPEIAGDEIKRLGQRREKLIKPVDDIFQKDLKPRLERLPTRAQRQAVEPAEKKAGDSEKP